MRIDSHQHFWHYNPIRDCWIDDSMEVIKNDFLPQNLAPLIKKQGIDGVIAVQADQSEQETIFLLQLAAENSFIKGVIGWLDLQADDLEKTLDFFCQNKKLKGLRHIVQAESSGFILREKFLKGIGILANYNLVYDILVTPNMLEDTIKCVKKFPQQKFVLNHLAKPYIKKGLIEPWKKNIEKLASYQNVYCKVSGMVTEAHWQQWVVDDLRPYFQVVFEAFGVERLLFGSDWPVCLLAASYDEVIAIQDIFLNCLSKDEQKKIMGINAIKIYNL